MPNGVDRNFRRLLMACAAYRQEHGEWPVQARLSPALLHDVALLFSAEDFMRLAQHLELRTRESAGISVGGRDGGVVEYADVDHSQLDRELVALAEEWLGVQVRRDLGHG